MKEEIVSYEQAKRLKECGFDWECKDVYPSNLPDNAPFDKTVDAVRYFQLTGESLFIQTLYPAPSLSLAQKWLREVKGWHIQVRINGVRSAYWYEIWSTTPNGPVYGTPDDDTFRRGQYETYESALSAGIDAALNLLTEKQ